MRSQPQLTPTALRELLSVCSRIDQGLRAGEAAAASNGHDPVSPG